MIPKPRAGKIHIQADLLHAFDDVWVDVEVH